MDFIRRSPTPEYARAPGSTSCVGTRMARECRARGGGARGERHPRLRGGHRPIIATVRVRYDIRRFMGYCVVACVPCV